VNQDELDLLEALHGALESQPYHVFLGVDPECAGDELRSAFHQRAALFHPDRFHAVKDKELRAQVYAVYKRITEAYRVLGDPESRKMYEQQRAQGAIRLDRDRPAPPKRVEDALSPQAKKYWTMALDSERRGDLKGAKLNLQMALQLEPGSALLKEKLEKLK
jgi:curved DNA-binding protein CbpA